MWSNEQMEFDLTGSGSSLYWATVRMTINGVKGVYVLDTGGKAIVTKHTVDEHDCTIPSRIEYGSGTVIGCKVKGLVQLTKDLALDTRVLHRVSKFPFRDGVDGIFGLLPSELTEKNGIRSAEIDFTTRTVKFNLPPTYAQSICVNNFQHPKFKNKLWFFGNLRAFDVNGQAFFKKDVYFMLDTGATKALTFFNQSFKELEQCKDSPKLMRLEIQVPGSVIHLRLPVNSNWPVCLPSENDSINFAILGIQALNSLKSIHFEYSTDGSKITRLCIAQH